MKVDIGGHGVEFIANVSAASTAVMNASELWVAPETIPIAVL
jgi:hypothetical protein